MVKVREWPENSKISKAIQPAGFRRHCRFSYSPGECAQLITHDEMRLVLSMKQK
jgi:hypothetical protein